MQKVLGDFIHALRHAGLPISPAETLDALHAARLLGLSNPTSLKAGLGMTLAKSLPHQVQFERLFDQFFSINQEHLDEVDGNDRNTSIQTTTQKSSELVTEASSPSQRDHAEPVQSPLGIQLMSGDQANLQIVIASAAEGAGASQMQVFTQKSVVSYRIMQQLGEEQLNNEINKLTRDKENFELVEALRTKQQILRQQVRDYVEQQYLLFSKEKGEQLREDELQKITLSNIDQSDYQRMTRLVQKAAKQLASMHSRRRRITKRGLLDVRKTIAANAAYDGFLFHTKWKSTRIERPKVMVLCDVSGSVSRVSRFLLLFLYSLQDVLPRVRSFVFATDLVEVTDDFKKQDLEIAITSIMSKRANLPTDYGKALDDFKTLALKDIDPKTTVIMLGDARNNHADANSRVWQEVYQHSKRVLWLNPEGRFSWNSGDSIMSHYASYCSRVEHCSSLRDLTRILGSLLKHS